MKGEKSNIFKEKNWNVTYFIGCARHQKREEGRENLVKFRVVDGFITFDGFSLRANVITINSVFLPVLQVPQVQVSVLSKMTGQLYYYAQRAMLSMLPLISSLLF